MSVRPTQWKMLMNVDVSNTAFNRPILVTEYLNEITGYDCSKERQPLTDSCRKRFHKEIKGLHLIIVLYTNAFKFKIFKYMLSGSKVFFFSHFNFISIQFDDLFKKIFTMVFNKYNL